MENLIILNKSILVVYFIIAYIHGMEDGLTDITRVISALLLYVILNLGKGIFKCRELKYIFLLASLLLCTAAYLFINPLFIIFLPLTVFEINHGYIGVGFLILAFILLSILLIKSQIINELFLSASLSLLLYELSLKSFNKIDKLTKLNENLKDKNEKLIKNLQSNEEYENQMIYTLKLEERNKIAQEIHDKLGHTISGSIMQLEASKLLMEVDPEKSKSIMQTSIDSLRSGMESIRSTLKNIKPPAEQMGINKIKLLVNSFSQKSGINGRVFYEGNIDIITYKKWKIIYDNISEALTNAMKYSAAKNLWVKIQVLNKMVKTEIKDDGKGCIQYSKGLGITGIEERTENINGKIIIDGSDGFSVIILLPIL